MSSRVRVYDLARELGLTNKELMGLLGEQGLEVKSHSSTIEAEFADLVRDQVISQRIAKTAAARKGVVAKKRAKPPPPEPDEEQEEEAEEEGEEEAGEGAPSELHLKPPITVRELAEALRRKPNELIGELMMLNVFAAINQVLDVELVEKLCERHGVEFVRERRERPAQAKAKAKAKAKKKEAAPGKARPRPPVLAVLGHVDHGKTSLLDYIRESEVAKGEAGGITQHIGASVIHAGGQRLTFLDTPGHEAFTAMRARGANATDIVVLVVAADDGAMPQTLEAISHAKAANVPIVVAVNKMDLPGANPENVLTGLQQHGVHCEAWGGDVGSVEVSAATGQGVDELLERILLEAEMMELGGNPELPAEGLVIEAQLESGMGATANVLVRDGTLRVGDVILCGQHYGRVKALIDDRGKRIKAAGPSVPVKVLGLSGVPEAGDSLVSCDGEREAKVAAEEKAEEARQDQLGLTRHTTLEELFQQIEEEAREELKIVLKADVRGSLEAITDSLNAIESEKISIDVIHSGVGEITENDVVLAAASGAIVVGFHVRAMPGINRSAKQRGVEIRLYAVIYELLEDIRDAMRGRLQPEYRESPLGEAEILEIFATSKAGKICGCVVHEGAVRVGANAKVLRDEEPIYSGQVVSLRRFKEDVREVRSGLECGIRLDNFEDFEVGDIIKVSALEQIVAEL